MSDKNFSYLSDAYNRLKEIEQESVLRLGREKAFHFVELANDWIDLQAAMSRTYSCNELTQGLVYFYFFSLFKEVQWFQLHFLSGNYPLLGRGLRLSGKWSIGRIIPTPIRVNLRQVRLWMTKFCG
jgi:hypothetical protein